MPIRMLHSADWHIGKPFGRFAHDRAGVLRRARLNAVDRLALLARAGDAAIVLVAGDVFDSPGLADRDVLELMSRLAGHRALTWYMIPGNHDPATAGGIWDRVMRLGMPSNVHLLRQSVAVEIAAGVTLLPAPLTAKAVSSDPTTWMSAAGTPDGHIRVGLAHGSTQGFGSEGTASVAIAPTRARDAGLSYLALGDWHGTREIGPATWYAGTPEPDSFQDNDQGHALLVTIGAPNAPAIVERHRTAEMTWLARTVRADSADDLAPLLSEIADAGSAAANLLVELRLSGEVTLADDATIRARIEREIDPRVFHLRAVLDDLRLAPESNDIAALADPVLRQIALELQCGTGADTPDAAIAALALRRLYQAARAEEATS